MWRFGVTAFCALFLFSGCAKRLPPPGGPKDVTPPKPIRFIPGDGATNVPQNTPIVVEFDEPVDDNPAAVTIYPKPTNSFVDFGKRRIEVKYTPPLAAQTTYVLVLAPSFSDRHGNSLGRTLELAFSTGPKIDSLSIAGLVVSAEDLSPVRGALVALLADSTYTQPPLRKTFSGADGRFSFGFLPAERFWLLAETGTGAKFEPRAAEMLALSPAAVSAPAEEVVLVLAPNDTIPPRVVSVTARDHRTFMLHLSEVVAEPAVVSPEGAVQSIWLDPRDSTAFFVRLSAPRGSLTVRLCDRAENCANVVVALPKPAAEDSTPPKILLPQKLATVRPGEAIDVVADEPFSARFRVKALGTTLAVAVEAPAPNRRKLSFQKPPPKGERLAIVVDSLCDSFGNCAAETISVVVSRERLGKLCVHATGIGCEGASLFAWNGRHRFALRATEEGFCAELPGGRYTIWCICDADGDGDWTRGKLSPYKPPETLMFYGDTVSVRGGWETEIVW